MSTVDPTNVARQTSIDLEIARIAQKTAEVEHYSSLVAHQRQRYVTAYERCDDMIRKDAASGMVAAAVVLESDGKHIPTRLKKAAEVIKIAVFLLDPKAPA